MAGLLAVKCVTVVMAAAPAAGQLPNPTGSGATPPGFANSAPSAAAARRGTGNSPPSAAAIASPWSASLSSAPPVADGEQQVLLELRKRRQNLDAREAAVRARESVLAAAEQKLDQRVAELKVLQTRLERLEAERQQSADANWQGVVSLYEKMKPRDAARIFDDLEMPVLLHLVDRMKQSKASGILAAMQSEKARELTTELASLRERRTADAVRTN
ncbi:MAG: hypothetical protein M3Y41_09475 [Pseudomonadota bacterium]|nr:hypothetical protein [Pseudomonadota bacterium]